MERREKYKERKRKSVPRLVVENNLDSVLREIKFGTRTSKTSSSE